MGNTLQRKWLWFLALAAVLCASVIPTATVSAQDKDALAAAPVPVGEASPRNDSGAKRPTVTQKEEPDSAVFVAPDDKRPQVRMVGVKTDVARRYRAIIPPLPVLPFTKWRQWFHDHEDSVHCALEWRDENGAWFHGELRSTHFDKYAAHYRVGWGEFPGTGYDAYGIYIKPGRLSRDVDDLGRPVVVMVDEVVPCDYRRIEAEIRRYGAKHAKPGDPGTGGTGKENVGLGGPAYKPAQNSNTMVKYVLRACGYTRPAPERAVGWDTEPHFPYASDADAAPRDGP